MFAHLGSLFQLCTYGMPRSHKLPASPASNSMKSVDVCCLQMASMPSKG